MDSSYKLVSLLSIVYTQILTASTSHPTTSTTGFSFQTNNESEISPTSPAASCLPAKSEEEFRRYLDPLQEENTNVILPAVIFLAILAVGGLFGNILVLLVYSRKSRLNATDIFIMAIAAFDLLTNVLAIPGEIYNLLHFFDFNNPVLCRLRLFFNFFTTVTSAMVLLAVAVGRYIKICRPFKKQISPRAAKIFTWIFPFLAATLASPLAILNGNQTNPLPNSSICSNECSIDDEYRKTPWPLVYVGLQMLLFVSAYIPLTVLYTLIGIEAWRLRKRIGVPVSIPNKQKASSSNELNDHVGNSHDKHKLNLSAKEKYQEDLPTLKAFKITEFNEGSDNSTTGQERVSQAKDLLEINLSTLSHAKNSNDPEKTSEQGCDTNDSSHKSSRKFVSGSGIQSSYSVNANKKHEDNNHDTDSTSSVEANSLSRRASRKDSLLQTSTDTLSGLTTSSKENGVNSQVTLGEIPIAGKRADPKNRKPLKGSQDCVDCSAEYANRKKSTASGKIGHGRIMTRTNLMLFLISATLIIMFVPHLCLIFAKFLVPNFLKGMTFSELVTYNIFLRFYFVNSASNAIIYSICDKRFRDQVRSLFKCGR